MCVYVHAPQQGIPPLRVRVTHPSGGVRVLRDGGSDPTGNALGGTSGCCFTHVNQGRRGQVRKERNNKGRKGGGTEILLSSPSFLYPSPLLHRPLMEEKQL